MKKAMVLGLYIFFCFRLFGEMESTPIPLYDAKNRLSQIQYPDGFVVEFSYDSNGNRIQMKDRQGITSYHYDEKNRLIRIVFPNSKTLSYCYNDLDLVTEIFYPNGKSVVYSYDPKGKLQTILDPLGTTSFSFDEQNSQLSQMQRPNGITTHYLYNDLLQLSDVIHKKSDGSLLAHFHYLLNPDAKSLTITQTKENEEKKIEYFFDSEHRLVARKDSSGYFENYFYDEKNLLLKKETPSQTIQYTYDDQNRLVQANNAQFFYDEKGNLLKKISQDHTTKYEYDYDNRLIRFENQKDTVEFGYNGDGLLVSKSVNGHETIYLKDILSPLKNTLVKIQEIEPGFFLRIYRWLMGIENDKSLTCFTAYANQKLSLFDHEKSLFFLYDKFNENPIAFVDSQQKILDFFELDFFGVPEKKTSLLQECSTGEENFEPSTNLLLTQNRFFDFEILDFISQPPLPLLYVLKEAPFEETKPISPEAPKLEENPITVSEETKPVAIAEETKPVVNTPEQPLAPEAPKLEENPITVSEETKPVAIAEETKPIVNTPEQPLAPETPKLEENPITVSEETKPVAIAEETKPIVNAPEQPLAPEAPKLEENPITVSEETKPVAIAEETKPIVNTPEQPLAPEAPKLEENPITVSEETKPIVNALEQPLAPEAPKSEEKPITVSEETKPIVNVLEQPLAPEAPKSEEKPITVSEETKSVAIAEETKPIVNALEQPLAPEAPKLEENPIVSEETKPIVNAPEQPLTPEAPKLEENPIAVSEETKSVAIAEETKPVVNAPEQPLAPEAPKLEEKPITVSEETKPVAIAEETKPIVNAPEQSLASNTPKVEEKVLAESEKEKNSTDSSIDRVALKELLEYLTEPEGAIIDSIHNEIIIFGKKNERFPALQPEDFQSLLSSTKLGIKMNGVNDDQLFLFYEGNIQKSALANLLFDTSYLLKSLELGKDLKTKKTLEIEIPHYQSLFDRYKKAGTYGNITSHLHLLPQKPTFFLSEDKKMMKMQPISFSFQNESLETAVVEFEEHFLKHFNEYANIYPILEKIQILSKWSFLVGWIQKHHLDIQLPSISPTNSQAPLSMPTPKRNFKWHENFRSKKFFGMKKTKRIPTKHSFSLISLGEISLDFQQFNEKQEKQMNEWENAILQARLSSKKNFWTFESPAQEHYQAIVLPLLH
jgi:YD repeat-containing protein